jgi:hypothetical protein
MNSDRSFWILWILLDPFGSYRSFWILLDPMDPFGSYRSFWILLDPMDPFGSFWILLDPRIRFFPLGRSIIRRTSKNLSILRFQKFSESCQVRLAGDVNKNTSHKWVPQRIYRMQGIREKYPAVSVTQDLLGTAVLIVLFGSSLGTLIGTLLSKLQ